jgi:hypothetical protein
MATSSWAGPPDWHVYNPPSAPRETRTAHARELDRFLRGLDTVLVSRGSAPDPGRSLWCATRTCWRATSESQLSRSFNPTVVLLQPFETRVSSRSMVAIWAILARSARRDALGNKERSKRINAGADERERLLEQAHGLGERVLGHASILPEHVCE